MASGTAQFIGDTHFRGVAGTIDANLVTALTSAVAWTYIVSDATNATSAVLTIGVHGLHVGDSVVLAAMAGTGEGTAWSTAIGTRTITAVAATTITINLDTSAYNTYTASSGTASPYRDAIFYCGDCAENPANYATYWTAYAAAAKHATIPTFAVTGNHDKSAAAQTTAQWLTNWQADVNASQTADDCLVVPVGSSNTSVLILDSNWQADAAYPLSDIHFTNRGTVDEHGHPEIDASGVPGGRPSSNNYLHPTSLAWLDTELGKMDVGSGDAKAGRWAVVLFHHSSAIIGKLDVAGSQTGQIQNYAAFRAILAKHTCCVAVVHGHLHEPTPGTHNNIVAFGTDNRPIPAIHVAHLSYGVAGGADGEEIAGAPVGNHGPCDRAIALTVQDTGGTITIVRKSTTFAGSSTYYDNPSTKWKVWANVSSGSYSSTARWTDGVIPVGDAAASGEEDILEFSNTGTHYCSMDSAIFLGVWVTPTYGGVIRGGAAVGGGAGACLLKGLGLSAGKTLAVVDAKRIQVNAARIAGTVSSLTPASATGILSIRGSSLGTIPWEQVAGSTWTHTGILELGRGGNASYNILTNPLTVASSIFGGLVSALVPSSDTWVFNAAVSVGSVGGLGGAADTTLAFNFNAGLTVAGATVIGTATNNCAVTFACPVGATFGGAVSAAAACTFTVGSGLARSGGVVSFAGNMTLASIAADFGMAALVATAVNLTIDGTDASSITAAGCDIFANGYPLTVTGMAAAPAGSIRCWGGVTDGGGNGTACVFNEGIPDDY